MDNERTSQTGYWVAGIIVALVVGGIVLWKTKSATAPADGTSTIGSTTVRPYGKVTVGLGESAAFNGITVTPQTVAEDSRCAAGVQCVWAGTVRLAIKSDFPSGSSRHDTVALGSTTPVGTFTVGLTAVTPAKKADSTIKNSDYRFTIEVHQNGTNSGSEELEGKG